VAFWRRFDETWWQEVAGACPALGGWDAQAHADAVRTFRELDAKLKGLNRSRLCARLRARRARPWYGRGSGEWFIRREARKKKRFAPLRRLFRQVCGILPRWKPCLIMSPIWVDPRS